MIPDVFLAFQVVLIEIVFVISESVRRGNGRSYCLEEERCLFPEGIDVHPRGSPSRFAKVEQDTRTQSAMKNPKGSARMREYFASQTDSVNTIIIKSELTCAKKKRSRPIRDKSSC